MIMNCGQARPAHLLQLQLRLLLLLKLSLPLLAAPPPPPSPSATAAAVYAPAQVPQLLLASGFYVFTAPTAELPSLPLTIATPNPFTAPLSPPYSLFCYALPAALSLSLMN